MFLSTFKQKEGWEGWEVASPLFSSDSILVEQIEELA